MFSLSDTAHSNLHNFKEKTKQNPITIEQFLWPDKNKMDF